MPRQFKPRRDLNLDRMFETRSEAWERVGLSVDVSRRTVKRAQREALVLVLLSARPFRVGERIRLQAGAVGGQVEGIVSSLGLLYTTLTRGADQIMIPNNVVLAAVVMPLKEPESVDVKVRLTSGVRPSQVQAILDSEIGTPTSSKAVLLEELDGDDVIVRVQATPEIADDGSKLADEIMAALSSVTGEHETATADRR